MKPNAVAAYIAEASHGPFCSDSRAARVFTESEIKSGCAPSPPLSVSASEPTFSPTYYEAAIPPPSAGTAGWCFWCGGRVFVHPDEGESADACGCVCVGCGMDRNGCRQGMKCRGFFVDQRGLQAFHCNARDLAKFRGIARERLIKSFGSKIKKIFEEFYLWRKAAGSQRPRGAAGSSAASHPLICPICHILYTPRSGFAGLCGACRVYGPIKPCLVREGVRKGAGAGSHVGLDGPSSGSGVSKKRR